MHRRCLTIVCTLVVCALLLIPAGIRADVKENLTYQGGKARIAVGNIKSKASDCSYDMAAAIGEMLSTALVNTDRFIVLASQEETAELAEEIDFAQSGYVEEGRGPEKGLMEGADVLITGAVTAFEPNAGGKSGGLGGFKKKAFGKIGMSSKTAKIIMDIKLIDIRTRRILKATSIEAKSSSWGTDIAGGGWTKDIALAGDLGVYSNEPMEKAIRTLLADMVETTSKEVPKEYFRYQGQGQYTTEYGSSGAASATASTASGASGTASASSAPPPAPAAEDMTLYTKYDFIPGDKVIFYDDMKNEEEGEFPYRWDLENGVFEVARLGGQYWIFAQTGGTIVPKMPKGPFPEKYTAELEFYENESGHNGNGFKIMWIDASDHVIGEFGFSSSFSAHLDINGHRIASRDLPERIKKGTHVLRIMATSRSLKCYIDNERAANMPKVENFSPVGFKIKVESHNQPDNPTLFRGFRFAEGGKSMRQQLDETGKIVTHGILFDPGSYTIKAESYKTLKSIGNLLEDDMDLRLSIEGHTDSDGSDTDNQTLSQNRAKAVRDYLISNHGIDGSRLESKGFGESQPIDTNDSPEGKANNRRVELIKL